MVENVDVFIYSLSQGLGVSVCLLRGFGSVPLSKIIWKLDLSAPKNMGPLEKLSRV